MNKANLIAYSSLIGIIIILLAIIYFRKPQVIVESDREKVLEDSIAVLNTRIDSSHVRQAKIQKAYDSLLSIDPIVISKTRDKIKFIYSTNSPDELDSIIRTNWKTKSRYR
jgi:hypothetical protein